MRVVDASVIVKALVPEINSASAIALTSGAQDLIVHSHAFAEVGEVLARKVRSGQLAASELATVISVLPKRFVQVDLAGILPSALDLALETGASVYDCLYVALAISSNCPLITADSRLIAKMAATPHAALLTPLDSFNASP